MQDFKKPNKQMNKTKTKWLVLFVLVVLAIAAKAIFFKAKVTNTKTSNIVENVKTAQVAESPKNPAINGVLTDQQTAELRPIAVVVENHPDSRPQSGLSGADIVYETLAEGGITRFLAVYQTQNPFNIGPIRSARIYFAEIANELGAVLAHVGGNSDALANIKNGVYGNISDADQFFNDPYFHRISARPMPHNVYTSIEKLRKLILDKNFNNQKNFQPWQFKDDSPVATSTAVQINIDFSLKDFAVKYVYEQNKNSYERFLAGKPHIDADTNKQITVKNVVVQFVKTYPTQTDTLYSIGMDLDSGGKASVFLDGRVIPATWKKTADGRTRYYDEQGSEISFNRGNIWVELVPVEKGLQIYK